MVFTVFAGFCEIPGEEVDLFCGVNCLMTAVFAGLREEIRGAKDRFAKCSHHTINNIEVPGKQQFVYDGVCFGWTSHY